MSMTLTYPFDTPSNYTYDPTKIEIVGSEAKLKLQVATLPFEQTFDNDTGFTYDATKAEFVGGQVQQKNKRPTDAIFYASFTTDEDAAWGDGTLTGTLVGGASISGGALVLSGTANCDWNHDNIATLLQTGCIRLRYKPLFSGAAPAVQTLFWANNNTQNRVMIRQNAGFIQAYIYDNSAVLICNLSYVFSPTANQVYEIELNFDCTTGTYRIFEDGVLKDSDTGAGTHGACLNFVRCGGDSAGHNCEILDLLIYDAVQHTANYTPDWTNIYEYDYLENAVILPEMEHVGDGSILAIASFSTVETYAPRYTLQVGRSGNYLYYNGAEWVTSNGTYAQANDAVTFNLNCSTINVLGEKYGQFKVLFPDNNNQSAVDTLTVYVTANNGYLTTNPMLECNSTFRTEGLEGFTKVSTITGSDNTKFILTKDGVDYYHDGIDWAASDGTYTQSNTAAEIEANKATFTTENILVKIKVFLHSDTGLTSPALDSITIEYDFAGGAGDTIETCIVWAKQLDAFGNPSLEPLTVETNKDLIKYKDSTMIKHERITITPDETGYWEAELIETVNMESGSKYLFRFANGCQYEKSVPNEATKNFWDLI